MEAFWIVTVIVFFAVIAVPKRMHFWINQLFASLWTPLRELENICRNYVDGFPDRCKRMLKSGGITSPPFAQKCFGTVFIFLVTGLSVLADLELIILTLQGMNMDGVDGGTISITGFSPSVLMGIVLMCGAAMMGLLVLER